MKVSHTPLEGLLIIEPTVYSDERGFFFESYQQERYAQHGMPIFVQDNFSRSKKNVLRGLHFQHPHAQGKLVGVTHGSVWDVAVDIRKTSPTFGKWFGITLSSENHLQMYVPPGFAHGFCVLSEEAEFYYKCTEYYTPKGEHGIAWNDSALNIPWPITHPILSSKDELNPILSEIHDEKLFT